MELTNGPGGVKVSADGKGLECFECGWSLREGQWRTHVCPGESATEPAEGIDWSLVVVTFGPAAIAAALVVAAILWPGPFIAWLATLAVATALIIGPPEGNPQSWGMDFEVCLCGHIRGDHRDAGSFPQKGSREEYEDDGCWCRSFRLNEISRVSRKQGLAALGLSGAIAGVLLVVESSSQNPPMIPGLGHRVLPSIALGTICAAIGWAASHAAGRGYTEGARFSNQCVSPKF